MTPINTRKGQINPLSPYDATRRLGKQQQVAAPLQSTPNGMVPGDGYEAPMVQTPPPPPYHQVIGQLRSSLTKFDKELKSKVGLKAAKGAAGGTLIGSAIFGGIVGHLASTSAVTGTLVAKAGVVLAAAHFWPVAVLIACIAMGAGVGLLFKKAKLKRLATREMAADKKQIEQLRNTLLAKTKQPPGLTAEEHDVLRLCTRILGRFHLNPLRALGETALGTALAAPVGILIAGWLYAMLQGGSTGSSSSSGGSFGGGGGSLGGGGGTINMTNFWLWNPYYYGGSGDFLPSSSGPAPAPRLPQTDRPLLQEPDARGVDARGGSSMGQTPPLPPDFDPTKNEY